LSTPNPIEVAVAPLRTHAVERAEQEALRYIEEAREELEANGWDVNAVAPYPRTMGYGINQFIARFKYENYRSITEEDQTKGSQRSLGSVPYFVVMSPERCKRFVENRKKQAAADYDAFVEKLVKKIGPVLAAELDGNHVWAHSILTVTIAGGEKQRWKTQQITNISKYGKHFNQWPSRKLK
jgi:hypothetical protein